MKILHNKTIPLKILISSLLCIILFLISGCSNKLPWKFDAEYSSMLLLYNRVDGTPINDIADSVDLLLMFETKSRSFEGLPWLFSQKIVFHSTDKTFIKNFIHSAQINNNIPTSAKNNDAVLNTYQIVLLDNNTMRVGWLSVKVKKEYGEITTISYDSNKKTVGYNHYDNKELIRFLPSNFRSN